MCFGLNILSFKYIQLPMYRFAYCCALLLIAPLGRAAETAAPLPTADLQQASERTCFQTSKPFSELGDLGSDVAITYGIDADLPARIQTWRDHGYRIHVMTGRRVGSLPGLPLWPV